MKITLAEGAGGVSTTRLISEVFAKHFHNPILAGMEDAAVFPSEGGRIAMTTDSFVVTPLFFKGGDIGRLAIAGTVNDLLMRGATPRYLTAAFIIETGTDTDTLDRIAASMAATAKEAGVMIVAGDTKVVEGNGQVFINTTGVGFVSDGVDISASNAKEGDVILVSGTLGDHHAALLSARMGIENAIASDAAPLTAMVKAMLDGGISGGIRLHTMRDVTRGGLGTVLAEIADASGVGITLTESALPMTPAVKSFCGLLGLSPLYMGNEGKLIAVLPAEEAERALEIVRACPYGENAAIIGRVEAGKGVTLVTSLGGKRKIGPLVGEGLPRIC